MSEKLGPVDIEFVFKNVNITQEAGRIKAELQGITTTARREVDETNNALRTLGSAIAAYFSFTAMKGFTSDVIRVRGEFQQLGIALETMLGSKEKADRLQAQIVDMASRTPFSLQEVSQGVKQLLAYQESEESVIDTTRRLGDVSAGLSVPIGRLIMAYGQIRAKGKLMGDDLRQLTEAGVPMIAELAKHFGIAESHVNDMVSAGKVGFEDVRAVIMRLTDEGGMFFNLMEKQSKSLSGMVSNLGDAWDRMLNQIGESNENMLAGGIRTLITLVENYQKVIDALKVLAITYGTYRAALVATTIAKNGLTVAENLHYVWLVAVEKAQKLLNATIMKNPYAWAAAGIAAIVSSLMLMSRRAKEATLEQEALARINDEVGKGVAEQKARVEMLRSAARDERLSNQQRSEAIKQLKELMPGYNAELSKEGRLINENTEAIKAYLKQLEIKIKQQAAEKELTALYEKEREQLKELEQAQQRYNARKQLYQGKEQSQYQGVVFGESGMAAEAAKSADLTQLENSKRKAEESLQATRNAIRAINEEIINGQLSLAGLVEQTSSTSQSSLNTIKKLEDEIAELERRYKEQTDINDIQQLEELRRLIIAKRKELERYKIEIDKDKGKNDDKKVIDQLLDETQTYQQKRLALEFQYQQKLAALKRDTRTTGDNLVELRKQHQAELDELDSQYGITVERYKYLYDSITALSVQMLRERIQMIKETLAESGLSEQIQADALRALSAAEEALLSRAPLAALGHINRQIAELKAKVSAATNEADAHRLLNELTDAEQYKAKALLSIFGNVAARLGEARELASYLSDELALAVDLASNLASAFASIASGNYIQGAIQLAASVVQLGKYFDEKRQKAAEEAQQRRMEVSNRLIDEANSLLARQLELLDKIRGSNVYVGLADSQQKLNAALADYIAATEKLKLYNRNDSYYTWQSSWFNGALYKRERVKMYREYGFDELYKLMGEALKAPDYDNIGKVYDEIERLRKLIGDGTIFGDTKALEQQLQQYEELLKQAEALAAKQAEILTGSTYDGVVDALASAFDDGIYSAEEFAKSFEELMKKAMLNALKINALKGPLDAWYKEFARMAEGGLSSDEIAKLRESYMQIAAGASKAFEELNGITGIDFSTLSDDANSLSGAIKGMSEDTASILAGQFNALRINSAEHLNVARQALIHQAKTAVNTENTVRMLTLVNSTMAAKLDAIEKKLDNDLRAKGL